MKNLKKFAAVVLTACTVFAMTGLSAMAAEGDYGYSVKVSGGNKGTVSAEKATGEYAYGESFSVSAEDITVNDAKYYVKGFAQAGDVDTISPEANLSITVTEDTEIVTIYGIENSSTVTYTVKFVDYDDPTKELAPADTYRGQIGDKPTVSHKYIEGYTSLALKAEKTLVDGENVFTFYYANNTIHTVVTDNGTIVTERTEYVTTGGTGTGNGTGNGAGNGNGEAVTEEGAGGENGEAVEEGGNGETTEIEEGETPLEQQEVVDLDEEESPLAGGNVNGTASGMPAGTKAGIAIGIIAILAIIIAFAARKKKA